MEQQMTLRWLKVFCCTALSFALFFLTACAQSPTPELPPARVSVTPSLSSFTSTLSPTTTSSAVAATARNTPGATMTRSQISNPTPVRGESTLPQLEASSTPTVTPRPVTTAPASSPTPTRLVLSNVDSFIAALQSALDAPDIDGRRRELRPLIHPDILLEVYPAGELPYIQTAQDAVGALSHTWQPASPTFYVDDIAAQLLPDVDATALYNGELPLEAVVYSKGWGLVGSGEALLFLTRLPELDELRLAGLVVSYDNFQPPAQTEIVQPPAGLLYRTANDWKWILDSGDSELLVKHPGPLSFSPSLNYALYTESGSREIILFETAQGISRTLSIDATLMQGSWHIPWLDEQTAVLMVMEPGSNVSQSSIGNLALFDIATGALQLLEPQCSVYARPTTLDGAIAFDRVVDDLPAGNAIWRDGAVMALDLSDVQWVESELTIFHPHLSPDGGRVAGMWDDGNIFAPYSYGYIVADLIERTAQTVHAILPVPTDAGLGWGIHWSPDGQWLALAPPSWDIVESGAWIINIESGQKNFLGPLTSAPLWFDGAEGPHLLFTATVAGETKVYAYDPLQDERVAVDLPLGAIPIQMFTRQR